MKAIVWPLGRKGLNPTRLVALGFGIIILLGAALLHLPIAAREGEATSWLVCLFTAASATCVTGLVQVDTVLHWSPFGQGVILLLLQLGGLGFVSLITLVSLALQRRIGLSQRLVMASALNLSNTAGVVRVVRHALMGTFLIEGLGALLLSTRFIPLFGWGKGLWFSLFHSVSAFCNTLGYCSGIENYSRVISQRPVGSAPMTPVSYTHLDVYKRQPDNRSSLFPPFRQNNTQQVVACCVPQSAPMRPVLHRYKL